MTDYPLDIYFYFGLVFAGYIFAKLPKETFYTRFVASVGALLAWPLILGVLIYRKVGEL